MGHALHFGIAIAIEREKGLQNMLFAVRNVDVLRFRSAQIVPVEVTLLQHLSHPDMNPCTFRLADPQSESPCDILSQIHHGLPGGSMDQLSRRQLLQHLYREAAPGR